MNVCSEMDALFPYVMSQPFCHCRKRLEQQQKMLEEDRKRRQFEEQKQKLRLLSSVKPKVRPASHRESARQHKDGETVCSRPFLHRGWRVQCACVCSDWPFGIRLEKKAATMPWRPSRATWMASAEMRRCTLLKHHRPKNKVRSQMFCSPKLC